MHMQQRCAHSGPLMSYRKEAVVRQFSVRLKNEPGALATLAEALADRDIDIRLS